MPFLPTTSGLGMQPSISNTPIRPLATETAAPDASRADGALKDACKEFESLFLYHLLKEMRASIPKDGYLGTSRQSETYTSMFDIEIARDLSEQKGIGLADFLMRQLANRLNETEFQSEK